MRRALDPQLKEKQKKQIDELESREKELRRLEQDSRVAPARLRGSTKAAPVEGILQFEYNGDKTVVSLPIKLSDFKTKSWFLLEERFFKEYDKVREVSLKLLFGKLEKEKRLGTGQMEEKVFTIGPFEESRVVLSEIVGAPEEWDTTYYNASWIGKEFIACSMPQGDRAREAFWRMVYEYDIATIVMLNEDSEGYRRHPDITRYVPNVMNEWESYGIMEVLKIEQVSARNMAATVRKLKIRRKDDIDVLKELTHLQYIDWPDGGLLLL